MGAAKFSKAEAIGFGWSRFKGNLWFLVGVLAVLWTIAVIFQLSINATKTDLPILSAIMGLVSWVVQSLLGMGLLKIALKLHDNQKASFADLLKCYPLLLKYLASSILYGLVVALGTILLIVPGIIMAIRLQFFSYLIIDKNQGPIEALNKSFAITKGSGWNLFLLWLLFLGIALIGTLALLIGLFAAMPTIMLAAVFVYRKLSA